MTFEEAIAQAGAWLAQGVRGETGWVEGLRASWETELGPRAFWVSLLTGDCPWADDPPPAVVAAVAAGPPILVELLVKNLAMSTAMALTHERQNHPEGAAGSRQVQRRSLVFLQALRGPALQTRLRQLQAAALGADLEADNGDGAFLAKWGYDEAQRARSPRLWPLC
ncbi:MAG: hypothetical protein HC918_12190 [Oscillatoriales cyanobacterium SM2_1_8]|nr:hypothetical protein [Oscillatoriales cyanobacterium SM2_1_8]